MKRYAYMNEKIREPEPSGPVIVVQTGKKLTNTNHVRVVVGGKVVAAIRFLKTGLKDAPQHKVRAFVEFFDGAELEVE